MSSTQLPADGAKPPQLARRSWSATRPNAVLLHGSSSSGGSWWRIGAALSRRGWSVDALDLPGHGVSARGEGAATPAAFADRVIASLPDQVDLLVGHSLGALVALEVAARRPAQVARLVLEEPPGPQSIDGETMADELLRRAADARADPARKVREIRAACPRWQELDCRQAAYDVIACDDEYLSALLRGGASWATIALGERVAAPTLVLLAPDAEGRFDDRADGTALRGRERRDLLDALGDAEHRVLDTGHCVHRDDPGGWLAAVEAFVR